MPLLPSIDALSEKIQSGIQINIEDIHSEEWTNFTLRFINDSNNFQTFSSTLSILDIAVLKDTVKSFKSHRVSFESLESIFGLDLYYDDEYRLIVEWNVDVTLLQSNNKTNHGYARLIYKYETHINLLKKFAEELEDI